MNRAIGLFLWGVVIAVGLWMWINRRDRPAAETHAVDGGKVVVNVPWRHLPDIDPFVLTERSGQPFDSRTLAGRPYVVTFFFASCPTVCRNLNQHVQRLAERYRDEDVTFVSVTVDPKTDTPEILSKYASDYGADGLNWVFLTGQPYMIDELGQHQFQVLVDKSSHSHTSELLLVDRWGRYRDRFSWDDPAEAERFDQVLRDVLAETEPPLDRTIATRNATAGVPHDRLGYLPWLNEFHLVDQNGQPFFSRDLTGQVWIASFFFTSCPTICPRQNEFLSGLGRQLGPTVALVSITSDPGTDSPAVLRQYARRFHDSTGNWRFLTGDPQYIRRVASEFFHAAAGPDHHSTLLFVVDRWGNVRGQIDWQDADATARIETLVAELNREHRPPADVEQSVAAEAEQ
jgi:cytochrome oxidase Cu insertion factor (SCO1/SenC/PrrC family)